MEPMEPYCVTFFWNHFSPDKEKAHAKAMAEAANYAGIKHVIWSTLDDTRKLIPLSDDRMPTLMGKYKVPHFDAKGEANHFFTDLGLPVTLLNTVFYWDNFIYFGLGPKKGPDGKLAITMPMGDKKLPGIAAADIGKMCFGNFQSRKQIYRKNSRNSRGTFNWKTDGRRICPCSGQGSGLQFCSRRKFIVVLVFRVPKIWEICSSLNVILRRNTANQEMWN